MDSRPDTAIFVLTGDPRRRAAGKDTVTIAYITDIVRSLSLTRVHLLILGSEEHAAEEAAGLFAEETVVEHIRAPGILSALVRIFVDGLRGIPFTMSELLFLSRSVESKIIAITKLYRAILIFDTIRAYSANVAPHNRSFILLDDLFSDRYKALSNMNSEAVGAALGRYKDHVNRIVPLFLVRRILRSLLRLEADLCRTKEMYVAREVRAALILNSTEAGKLTQRSGASTIYTYIPRIIAVNSSEQAKRPTREAWIVVGAFSYAPNADGLSWLLTEIYPRYLAIGGRRKLTIIGRDAPEVLINLISSQGGDYLGYVDNLDRYYNDAFGALVPVRFGTGIKIKLIEALAHGCFTVCTAFATEGLPDLPAKVVRTGDAAAFAQSMREAELRDLSEERQLSRQWYASQFGPSRLLRLRSILMGQSDDR